MEKKVLGKGLEALIPKRPVSGKEREFAYLEVAKITLSKYQPRQEIDSQEMEELKASIKEKGMLQPVIVRKKKEGGYEIVAGGRRFSAAKLLGINEIPAIVKELDDSQALVYAIVENLQRKNLNPLEEAQAFRRLVDEFSFTQEEIAKMVGKSKTFVANLLRLLKLPPQIQQALREGRITYTQARTILSLNDPWAQEHLFQELLHQNLSVRELENRVRGKRKKQPPDPFIREMEERLQRILGTKVRVFHRKDNRGRIVIEYYNFSDLDRIINKFL